MLKARAVMDGSGLAAGEMPVCTGDVGMTDKRGCIKDWNPMLVADETAVVRVGLDFICGVPCSGWRKTSSPACCGALEARAVMDSFGLTAGEMPIGTGDMCETGNKGRIEGRIPVLTVEEKAVVAVFSVCCGTLDSCVTIDGSGLGDTDTPICAEGAGKMAGLFNRDGCTDDGIPVFAVVVSV